ncbi:MAG: phage portal protein [Desulfovibrio sp.]|nr:phage portal protein [Desulfovibrio sp.]
MGVLDFIFGKKKAAAKNQTVQHVRFINEPTASFSNVSGVPGESDIVVAAIDALARNISKLKGSHYVDAKPVDNKLTRLLQIRPNPIMSAADLLYKAAAIYFLTNNSFIFIERDDAGNTVSLMPVDYSSAQFFHDAAERVYVQFVLRDGQKVMLAHSDLVHLRRHYSTRKFTGDDNRPIMPTVELARVQNEGLVASIESSACIRGVLKYEGLLNEKTVEEQKERFKESFLTSSNDGGVIVCDQKTSFQPLEMKPFVLDSEQSKEIKNKIFSYYGITENIVTSSYTEDEFGAFYESVIEPFSLQLSLELTAKIFTEREIAFGNRILYEAGRLQFASNNSKIKLVKELMPTGLLTVNQCLEIFNLPPVADGDRRIQSLNYIDQAAATQYQLARANGHLQADNEAKEGDNDNEQ